MMLSTMRSLYVRSSTNLGRILRQWFLQTETTRCQSHSPDCELDKHLGLLLGAPSSTAQDVVLHHGGIDTVSFGNVANSIGSEGASAVEASISMVSVTRSENVLGVDVCDSPRCPTLIFRKLSRDAESVTELGLSVNQGA